MRTPWIRITLAAAASLACADIASAQRAVGADAQELIECVSKKEGPEGDLPSAGALRSKILKDMEGGSQSCIGLVRKVCVEAGGDHHACSRKETAAWLDALKLDPTDNRRANHGKWTAAVKNIRGQAQALCQGAAALSAWGYDTVRTKGSYSTENLSGCIMDGVAQQALILLVHARGN